MTLSVILALFPGLAIAGTAGLDVTPGASLGIASSSVTFTQIGLTGEITSDIITSDLDGDGVEEVILGTSKGLYVISDGKLRHFIPTSSFVMDVVVLGDITGDGQSEIAISVGDIYFPNIRCYDSATTTQLWQFAPRQEVFIENLMWTDLQTFTYDLESVDINSDGFKDLVATSGYFIYSIDGRTGDEIWKFEAVNNVWDAVVVPDLDGDTIPDIVVGSQIGYLYVLSGLDGNQLWRERIAEEAILINDRGSVGATVDRSVWDVFSVAIHGNPKVVVCSEDGKIRLIDLSNGEVEWETSLINYVGALLYKYYQQKQDNPSSPGDYNFLNLQGAMVPDVTGDGVQDILALSYAGKRGGEGGGEESTSQSGLFLLNTATGSIVWESVGIDLGNVGQVEIVMVDGDPILLLPRDKSGSKEQVEMIDLESGTVLRTVEIRSSSTSYRQNVYRVKKIGDESFLLASDYGDLLSVLPSEEGTEVLWDYPRITNIEIETGDFVGDDTSDILVYSKTFPSGDESRSSLSRVLFVLDGDTRQQEWLYTMPYDEFALTGGIDGLMVTPDLDGDGKQDIVGFIQPPFDWSGENFGEDSRIIGLSGRDGSVIFYRPVTDQTFYGVWGELYDDPSRIEEILWAQFESQTMGIDFPNEWERVETEKWQNEFEPWLQEELNRLQGDGWIEAELQEFEDVERDLFEQQLQSEKLLLEEDWRRSFEQDQLPQR
ncbi:PQQ-binding-like beta-propeller repeat protein [Chloroflexota bacterium]